jgi:hypothetical protein
MMIKVGFSSTIRFHQRNVSPLERERLVRDARKRQEKGKVPQVLGSRSLISATFRRLIAVAQARLTRVLQQAEERPAALIRSTAPESSMMNRAVPSPFPSILKTSVSIQ